MPSAIEASPSRRRRAGLQPLSPTRASMGPNACFHTPLASSKARRVAKLDLDELDVTTINCFAPYTSVSPIGSREIGTEVAACVGAAAASTANVAARNSTRPDRPARDSHAL